MTQPSPEQPKPKLLQLLNAVGNFLLRVDNKLDDWLEDYLERKRLYREQNPKAPTTCLFSNFLPRPLDKLWDTLSEYTIYLIWFIFYRCFGSRSNGDYGYRPKGFKDYYISKRNYVGFTLFEMAIVLVVIGLMVGGLLAGRGLIEAARVLQVVSEVEKLRMSAQTFRLKYECLAGDCDKASRLGLGTNGNGNGAVDEGFCNSGNQTKPANVELYLFWQHFGNAGFLNKQYTGVAGTSAISSLVNVNVPPSTYPGGEYSLINILSNSTAACSTVFYTNANYSNAIILGSFLDGDRSVGRLLKPSELMSIDQKIDDGRPSGGDVTTLNPVWYNYAFSSSNCTSAGDASEIYNVTYDRAACHAIFAEVY